MTSSWTNLAFLLSSLGIRTFSATQRDGTSSYNGTMTSLTYIKQKGVSPMEVLILVL